MKPTPPAPEATSMKRTRSATKPSAMKRKVLMDDSMVLLGEYVFLSFLFCYQLIQFLENLGNLYCMFMHLMPMYVLLVFFLSLVYSTFDVEVMQRWMHF